MQVDYCKPPVSVNGKLVNEISSHTAIDWFSEYTVVIKAILLI